MVYVMCIFILFVFSVWVFGGRELNVCDFVYISFFIFLVVILRGLGSFWYIIVEVCG